MHWWISGRKIHRVVWYLLPFFLPCVGLRSSAYLHLILGGHLRNTATTMKLNLLGEWLSWFEYQQDYSSSIFSTFEDTYDNHSDVHHEFDSPNASNSTTTPDRRKFTPQHELCERDNLIIDMLNSASTAGGTTTVSFCVTDPSLHDNPVIFCSDGFCHLTGYSYEEVVGQNCRFLQGEETNKDDVKRIMMAVKEERECTVRLLNYRKDGSSFLNEVSNVKVLPELWGVCLFIWNDFVCYECYSWMLRESLQTAEDWCLFTWHVFI